jgi:hypothetical protein
VAEIAPEIAADRRGEDRGDDADAKRIDANAGRRP